MINNISKIKDGRYGGRIPICNIYNPDGIKFGFLYLHTTCLELLIKKNLIPKTENDRQKIPLKDYSLLAGF